MNSAAATASSSDYEKLQIAFATLTGHFSSVDDMLTAFGLKDMPVAQQYGILFGFVVFSCTIASVLALLIFGGSFARIAEQAQDEFAASIPNPVAARRGRPLLLEELLDARKRMMAHYPLPPTTTHDTNLTTMLLNLPIQTGTNVAALTDENAWKRKEQQRFVPPGYQQDYVEAYRKCQEKPSGRILSGRPECRFEAYSRSYAGCGSHVTREYRRSYARLYEHVSCQTHALDDKFSLLYQDRPQDIMGRLVRLEALDVDRHAVPLMEITCGQATLDQKEYDPNQVWGFLPYGPFAHPDELVASPIFTRRLNEAGFAIHQQLSDKLLGVLLLTKDDPSNLSINIEAPIVAPWAAAAGVEIMEATFLILDKLFALGYRRVEMAVDSQDFVAQKFASRMGFTKDADCVPKHCIVKDANRDSTIYGMLNSDWNNSKKSSSCRSFLFTKLHGSKLAQYDASNNKKEQELDEQAIKLAILKQQEADAAAKKK